MNRNTTYKNTKTIQKPLTRLFINCSEVTHLPQVTQPDRKHKTTILASTSNDIQPLSLKIRDYNRVVADIKASRAKSLHNKSEHVKLLNKMLKTAIYKSKESPERKKKRLLTANEHSDDSCISLDELPMDKSCLKPMQKSCIVKNSFKIRTSNNSSILKSALKRRSETVTKQSDNLNSTIDISNKPSILNIREIDDSKGSIFNRSIQFKCGSWKRGSENKDDTSPKNSLLQTTKKVSFISEDVVFRFNCKQKVSKTSKDVKKGFLCGLF